MRTKEEILDRYAAKTNWEFDKHDPGYEVALGAMEVYAKEVHFGFKKWVEEIVANGGDTKDAMKKLSNEELYNQFIQSLNH